MAETRSSTSTNLFIIEEVVNVWQMQLRKKRF